MFKNKKKIIKKREVISTLQLIVADIISHHHQDVAGLYTMLMNYVHISGQKNMRKPDVLALVIQHSTSTHDDRPELNSASLPLPLLSPPLTSTTQSNSAL